MDCLLKQGSYFVATAADYGKGLIRVPRNTFPRNAEQQSKFSVEQYTVFRRLLIANLVIDAEQYMLVAFL